MSHSSINRRNALLTGGALIVATAAAPRSNCTDGNGYSASGKHRLGCGLQQRLSEQGNIRTTLRRDGLSTRGAGLHLGDAAGELRGRRQSIRYRRCRSRGAGDDRLRQAAFAQAGLHDR
jgi:hypothetical protein